MSVIQIVRTLSVEIIEFVMYTCSFIYKTIQNDEMCECFQSLFDEKDTVYLYCFFVKCSIEPRFLKPFINTNFSKFFTQSLI